MTAPSIDRLLHAIQKEENNNGDHAIQGAEPHARCPWERPNTFARTSARSSPTPTGSTDVHTWLRTACSANPIDANDSEKTSHTMGKWNDTSLFNTSHGLWIARNVPLRACPRSATPAR